MAQAPLLLLVAAVSRWCLQRQQHEQQQQEQQQWLGWQGRQALL